MKTTQIVLAVILAASVDAMARERSVTRSRTGRDVSRNTTVTGAQGKSVSLERTREMDAGTLKKDTTVTGPNGQTAERSSTANRTDDGYTKSATATGPQGNSITRDTQGVWDPVTKTWTKSTLISREKQDSTIE
jgi:hypothetical protein